MWFIEDKLSPPFFSKLVREGLWYGAMAETNFKGRYFLTDGNASALKKKTTYAKTAELVTIN